MTKCPEKGHTEVIRLLVKTKVLSGKWTLYLALFIWISNVCQLLMRFIDPLCKHRIHPYISCYSECMHSLHFSCSHSCTYYTSSSSQS